MKILADHNIVGQCRVLYGSLQSSGWTELLDLELVTFHDVALPGSSSDTEVWEFAQQHNMILLTGNRNMEGSDSLEQTIRDQRTHESLPVVTIADPERVYEKSYGTRCADRLAEILVYIEDFKGTGRLFIP